TCVRRAPDVGRRVVTRDELEAVNAETHTATRREVRMGKSCDHFPSADIPQAALPRIWHEGQTFAVRAEVEEEAFALAVPGRAVLQRARPATAVEPAHFDAVDALSESHFLTARIHRHEVGPRILDHAKRFHGGVV